MRQNSGSFPIETKEKTAVLFEEIYTQDNSKNHKVTVATKKNDPRLNADQRADQRSQLQGWRTNCDIQT